MDDQHHEDRHDRRAGRPSGEPSRRQFVRALGPGAAVIGAGAGHVGAQEPPVVAMGDTYFDPIGLFVEPGTTVRFEIEAGSHSATAYQDRIPEGATPFDSTVRSAGTFEYTFEEPGTYDYYCTPHRSMGMVGRIVVGEPGGPAEEGRIPDGSVPDGETIAAQGAVGVDEFAESGDGGRGGTMGGGSGMMDGGGPGWMVLVPIGFVSTLLALVGGVAYWAARRGHARGGPGDSEGDAGGGSAMATLRERYARGEVDDEEYAERKRRLQADE